MTTFDDLKFEPREMGKVQASHKFGNGYEASVIKGPYTYGGREGLYELAVILNGSLRYDTPVTNDVEGYCTPERITELLAQIEALPAAVAVK